MLPNSAEALALFFAAAQTGLYVVPVNWHLTAAEVAYILADSGARTFVAHERFGEVAAEAAAGAGIDPAASFAVGKVPGFTPVSALSAAAKGAQTAHGRCPDGLYVRHVGQAQGMGATR